MTGQAEVMFASDVASRSLGMELLRVGHGTAEVRAEISFVTSARLGDKLVATAEMRTRYGRNGIYDVTIRRDRDIIAEFRGRSRATNSAAPEVP